MGTKTLRQVEITQTVPVDTIETLRTYLVKELGEDGGKALDLTVAAGFTVRLVKKRAKKAPVVA